MIVFKLSLSKSNITTWQFSSKMYWNYFLPLKEKPKYHRLYYRCSRETFSSNKAFFPLFVKNNKKTTGNMFSMWRRRPNKHYSNSSNNAYITSFGQTVQFGFVFLFQIPLPALRKNSIDRVKIHTGTCLSPAHITFLNKFRCISYAKQCSAKHKSHKENVKN